MCIIVIIIFVCCPQFPASGFGCDMSCLHCFLSSAISSVMFNLLMSSSTTSLQVFFGLPTGFLLSTSSSITLLSMLFSSLCFTWPNHLGLVFLNLYSRFSTPNLPLTFSLVILSSHFTFYTYLYVLWSLLASSPSSLHVSYLFIIYLPLQPTLLSWRLMTGVNGVKNWKENE